MKRLNNDEMMAVDGGRWYCSACGKKKKYLLWFNCMNHCTSHMGAIPYPCF